MSHPPFCQNENAYLYCAAPGGVDSPLPRPAYNARLVPDAGFGRHCAEPRPLAICCWLTPPASGHVPQPETFCSAFPDAVALTVCVQTTFCCASAADAARTIEARAR